MKRTVINNVNDFNLDHIFDCGQCFRWKKEKDGSYTGTALGKIVNLNFEYDEGSDYTGSLILNGINESEFDNTWKNYLDLDRDYSKIKYELAAKDTVIKEAITKGRGIRILQQDLWETIASFIISQNNNIPRIKGCIEKLCNLFGEEAENEISELHIDGSDASFSELKACNIPTPEKLAELTVDDLSEVRLGYRARYLIDSANQVLEKGMPQTYEELCALTGVGPKVANCILLFGLGDMRSFPIDVWVKRVMNRMYGIEENKTKEMKKFAAETFGNLGGIAQQYLFYYIRETDKQK